MSIKLDLRAADAVQALCTYCEHLEKNTTALRTLLSIMLTAADWAVNPNVNIRSVLSRMTTAIFTAAVKLPDQERFKVTEIVTTLLVEWTRRLDDGLPHDPVHVRKCILGLLDGIEPSVYQLLIAQKAILMMKLCDCLEGTAFDIRILIADAPADFRLEDVVKEHFEPALLMWELIDKIVADVNGSDIERLRTLDADTTQSLCAYLINAVSSEPFLCSLLQQTICLYPPLGLMKTESESVLAILRSFKYFQAYGNFCIVFPTVCAVLVSSTEGTADTNYLYLGAVKSVLYSLCIKGEIVDYPDTLKTIREGGAVIGNFLNSLLSVDRVFCESFASNLVVEFPLTSRSNNLNEESESIGALAEVLGQVAIAAADEAVRRGTSTNYQALLIVF